MDGLNPILKCRMAQIKQQKPKTFDEFHSLICKSMPNVMEYPEMYDLCYTLMKITWETAKNKE